MQDIGQLTDIELAVRTAAALRLCQVRSQSCRHSDTSDRASAQGLVFDVSQTDAGERRGCRLEIYLTDRASQPDMGKWETQLAFRLAD